MKTATRRTISFVSVLLLAAITLALVPVPALAQIQTFLKIGDIKGSSTDYYHQDWIDVISLRQSFPVKRTCEIQVVKGLDKAGPELWAAAVKGTHFPEVRIDVMTKVGEGSRLLYEIRLSETIITSIVTSGGPSGTPLADTFPGMTFAETVTITGMRMRLDFYPVNPDGSSGGQESSVFNCP